MSGWTLIGLSVLAIICLLIGAAYMFAILVQANLPEWGDWAGLGSVCIGCALMGVVLTELLG